MYRIRWPSSEMAATAIEMEMLFGSVRERRRRRHSGRDNGGMDTLGTHTTPWPHTMADKLTRVEWKSFRRFGRK